MARPGRCLAMQLTLRFRTEQMFALARPRSVVARYDKLASRYDRLHRRWLRHAGGEAQAALEALVRVLATPDKQFLDAGCGTGNLARSLLSEGTPPATMTLLDPSRQMLAQCADLPVQKVTGRLEALPFGDSAFDIVTCVWALETTSDSDLALQELCRVVRPGGVLCLVFCADMPARGVADSVMRQALLYRGTGRFLSRQRVIETIEGISGFTARTIPSNGPAATLFAKRSLPSQTTDTHTRHRNPLGSQG